MGSGLDSRASSSPTRRRTSHRRCDINACIITDPISQTLTNIGLSEAVISSHSLEPITFSTYLRSDQHYIIDSIWTSPSLTICNSGYSAFEGWDHCLVWLDLDTTTTFGTASPIQPFPSRRLKTQDPPSVKKYLRHLKEAVQNLGLLQQARLLDSTVTDSLNPQQQAELEAIGSL